MPTSKSAHVTDKFHKVFICFCKLWLSHIRQLCEKKLKGLEETLCIDKLNHDFVRRYNYLYTGYCLHLDDAAAKMWFIFIVSTSGARPSVLSGHYMVNL